MRDTENSTNEFSEYDWNKGLAIALDIHKCGESRGREGDDDERDVCYKSNVLDSKWDVCYKSSVLDSEWDVCYKSSVLEEGDSRGHLGRRIYQAIREGGDSGGCDSSGCDISETGLNPIGEESAVCNDEARTDDILMKVIAEESAV
ncbi:hypothetical protein Tco_0761920 [Tanacetum coccineum]